MKIIGDAEEKMKVFESTGQISLAYITAKTHGLDADAEVCLVDVFYLYVYNKNVYLSICLSTALS